MTDRNVPQRNSRAGVGMINYITDLHRDIASDFRKHERAKERLKTGLDFNSQRLNARMWQMKQDGLNKKSVQNSGDLQTYLSQLGIIGHKGRPVVYGKNKNIYYEDLEDAKTGESILGGPPEIMQDLYGDSLAARISASGNTNTNNKELNWFTRGGDYKKERNLSIAAEDGRMKDLRAEVEADMHAAEQASLGNTQMFIQHQKKTSSKRGNHRDSVIITRKSGILIPEVDNIEIDNQSRTLPVRRKRGGSKTQKNDLSQLEHFQKITFSPQVTKEDKTNSIYSERINTKAYNKFQSPPPPSRRRVDLKKRMNAIVVSNTDTSLRLSHVPDQRKVHDLAPVLSPKELASLFKMNENMHLHQLLRDTRKV